MWEPFFVGRGSLTLATKPMALPLSQQKRNAVKTQGGVVEKL